MGKLGKGDGKKGAGKGLPQGAKTHTTTEPKKPICYNWNQKRECSSTNCTFEHICWFCEKSNHRGCEHNWRQS